MLDLRAKIEIILNWKSFNCNKIFRKSLVNNNNNNNNNNAEHYKSILMYEIIFYYHHFC